jgi:signal peptidase I
VVSYLAQIATAEPNRIVDAIARTPLSKIVIFAVICTAIRLVLYPYLKSMPLHRRSGLYAVARFCNEGLDALVYAAIFVFLLIRPFMLQMFQIPSESMIDTLQINDFIVANKAIYRYTDPKVGDIIVFRPPLGAVDDKSMLDKHGNVNQDFIKRCVGVPGDVVEVQNGGLYRNGSKIVEPYLKDNPFDGAFKLVHYQGDYQKFKGRYIPVVTNEDAFTLDCDINHGPSIHPGREFAIGVDHIETFEGTKQAAIYVDRAQLTTEEVHLQDELRESKPAAIPKGFYLMMGDNRNGSYDGRFWGLIPKSAIVGRAEYIVFPMRRMRKLR